MSIIPISIPRKKLSQSITSSSDSFKVNNILGWDGEAIAEADLGTQHFVVFLNDTRTTMEIMEIDPSTIADDSITILKRGLPFDGGQTEVSANKLDWPAGTTTIQFGTDVPQLLKEMLDISSDQTITGKKTFTIIPILPDEDPNDNNEAARKKYVDDLVGGLDEGNVKLVGDQTISSTKIFTDIASYDKNKVFVNETEIITKKYADDLAIAGGAMASTVTIGLTKLSKDPDNPEVPIARGENHMIDETEIPTPQSDAKGFGVKLEDDGRISDMFLRGYYDGGDGSDGDLIIESGTTNIDLGGSPFVVKNYGKIEISGSGKLTFSNPHAAGTIITLKSLSTCEITSSEVPCIDVSELGCSPGNVPTSVFLSDGVGGGGGAANSTNVGIAGVFSARVNTEFYAKNSNTAIFRPTRMSVGAQGGGGGTSFGTTSGAPGAGGRGSGSLLILTRGNLVFSGTIYARGANGANGANDSGSANRAAGSGGAGGAGGQVIIIAGKIQTNTGTIDNSGGNGGAGGSANSTSLSGPTPFSGGGGAGGSSLWANGANGANGVGGGSANGLNGSNTTNSAGASGGSGGTSSGGGLRNGGNGGVSSSPAGGIVIEFKDIIMI